MSAGQDRMSRVFDVTAWICNSPVAMAIHGSILGPFDPYFRWPMFPSQDGWWSCESWVQQHTMRWTGSRNSIVWFGFQNSNRTFNCSIVSIFHHIPSNIPSPRSLMLCFPLGKAATRTWSRQWPWIMPSCTSVAVRPLIAAKVYPSVLIS
jgi:hypothetical protein